MQASFRCPLPPINETITYQIAVFPGGAIRYKIDGPRKTVYDTDEPYVSVSVLARHCIHRRFNLVIIIWWWCGETHTICLCYGSVILVRSSRWHSFFFRRVPKESARNSPSLRSDAGPTNLQAFVLSRL